MRTIAIEVRQGCVVGAYSPFLFEDVAIIVVDLDSLEGKATIVKERIQPTFLADEQTQEYFRP